MDRLLLGIDIGTSKVAAVIVEMGGHLCASSSLPHHAILPAPVGHAEQDPHRLLETAWATVRSLPSKFRKSVRAVGVAGQMHGVVVLDNAGKPLTPLVTWQDQRCLEDGFLADLQQRTSQAIHSGYGCATLAWLTAQSQLSRDTAGACTIHDLAVAQLAGMSHPVTDYTGAASWGLYDLLACSWNWSAINAAAIPARLLPEIHPCGDFTGTVSREMAASLGISPGIPIAVAIGDNQASLLATLREPEYELALTLGTGGQLSAVLPVGAVPSTTHTTIEYRPYPGERFAMVASTLNGGSAWAWLADNVAQWLEALGLPCPPRDALYRLLNEAGLSTSNEMLVRPTFFGERHAPFLTGSIEGITPDNFHLGALARGMARGIFTNLRDMLPVKILASRQRVIGSGNALRRNPLLRLMAEKVFGLQLTLTESNEEAAVGAALNARALGNISSQSVLDTSG